MLAYERRNEIIKLLEQVRKTTATYLSKRFDVDRRTIYRDIGFLKAEYQIQTFKGKEDVWYEGKKPYKNPNKPAFYERRTKILEILMQELDTTANRLAEICNVCRNTILRDIAWLSLSEAIYTDGTGIHYVAK